MSIPVAEFGSSNKLMKQKRTRTGNKTMKKTHITQKIGYCLQNLLQNVHLQLETPRKPVKVLKIT